MRFAFRLIFFCCTDSNLETHKIRHLNCSWRERGRRRERESGRDACCKWRNLVDERQTRFSATWGKIKSLQGCRQRGIDYRFLLLLFRLFLLFLFFLGGGGGFIFIFFCFVRVFFILFFFLQQQVLKFEISFFFFFSQIKTQRGFSTNPNFRGRGKSVEGRESELMTALPARFHFFSLSRSLFLFFHWLYPSRSLPCLFVSAFSK